MSSTSVDNQHNPWEEFPSVWPTKASFFSWLRGCLRRAVWEKYPPKIIFKKSKLTKPPEGYTGRAKSGAKCALTGVWTGNSALQVDHVVGECSLRDWSDVLPFVQHLCTPISNMQLVEKEAHKIKTYAERNNLSFEEAILEKEVIQFKKLKSTEQISFLTDLVKQGILSSVGKNQDERVEQYRQYVKEKRCSILVENNV